MRMRKSAHEYYRTLGLMPGASARELRRAYLRLVKRWHPDQFALNSREQTSAQEKLKEINEAYSFLRDYRPGQTPYGDGYTWPNGYSRGATAEWNAYRQRANYEPPIYDPYEGDYQYHPIGNSRGNKWWWVVAAILIANIVQMQTGIGNYPTSPPKQGGAQRSQAAREEAMPMTIFAAQPADIAPENTRSVASPLPYFFVGSTKGDVYRIQGMPQWSNEHEWRYGDSRVYFSGAMVASWHSAPKFPLKAIDLPKVDPESVITKGSSEAEVLAIQGTPVSVNDVYWAARIETTESGEPRIGKTTYWHYGESSIQFAGDKVVGWTEKPSSPLKVQR